MAGQAVITINENQWSVSLATTYAELTTGLREVASINPGTGMLFILPSSQAISVDTTGMNFPIDIIFIANNLVVDVASNVDPGYLVTEETPCDSFLEVNANETFLVEVGDSVNVEVAPAEGFDFSSIMSFAMPLVVLGFVSGMVGGMAKLMGGSSHSSEARRLGEPKTEAERKKTHERLYGPEEEEYYRERGYRIVHVFPEKAELDEYITVTDPGKTTFKPGEVVSKETFDKENERVRKLGEREAKGVSSKEHHSMWLTPKQRETLEKKYGAVSVRWGEELAAVGDMETCEKAANAFYSKMKEAVSIA